MRDLDKINPGDQRPSRFVALSSCLPLILGVVSLPLAYGAAPDVPLVENTVAQVIFLVVGIPLLLGIFSSVLRWGWEASHYGFRLVFGGSISLFAIVPLLSLLVYGTASFLFKTFVLLFYVLSHMVWCRKFAVIYKHAFNNELLRRVMYQEEADAVYYLRRGDQFLLEKYYKFSQMPRDRYFVIYILLAFGLIPFADEVGRVTGIPFPHSFLLVAMIPVSWMSLGFVVRGFLVCYLYPSRIRKLTGKEVYVDMVGMHPPLDSKGLRTMTVHKG